MEKIKAARGTQDIFAKDSALWQKIEAAALELFEAAGFSEIRTPVFEATNLFSRAVGEDSDIVNKEMYTFLDKSDRSLTLRPEGTAAIVRAYIEHSLDRAQKPIKLWYRGPMFRYERPQTGRYRQFHQIGIEAFGSSPPFIDLEVISLAWNFLKKLGLDDLTLYINTLGSEASRLKYRDMLKEFLAPLQGDVCEDCQRRFVDNPLRALDCKVPEDQKLYEGAPSIIDSLDDESIKIWQDVKAALDQLGINYVEDNKLVRGLDYYSHVVFEIKASDKSLGAQSTVLAGGRYDKLVENLGGKSAPAVGWALGIERLALLLAQKESTEKTLSGLYIISDDVLSAQKLAVKLRSQTGAKVEFDFDAAKIGKQLDKANKKESRYALFYLEDERKSNSFKLKDLETGDEKDGLDEKQVIEIIKENN